MKASLLFFFPHKYSGSDLHVNMATFAGTGKLCGNKVYCSDQWEEVGWSLRQEPPVKADRWEAKIRALFLWHGTVNISSPLKQTLRNWEKKKKKEKTCTDPLAQTNTRHIKPESVGHCKKKNSINYLIRNLESHTISQRELGSELVIYFWYISGKRRCRQYP